MVDRAVGNRRSYRVDPHGLAALRARLGAQDDAAASSRVARLLGTGKRCEKRGRDARSCLRLREQPQTVPAGGLVVA